MSNSRAVYTNLREQGILEQRQEEQHMGVLARACMSVAVTKLFLYELVFSERLMSHLFSYMVKTAEMLVFGIIRHYVGMPESSVCSIGAEIIRMPSGETADSKAMVSTPFGIR